MHIHAVSLHCCHVVYLFRFLCMPMTLYAKAICLLLTKHILTFSVQYVSHLKVQVIIISLYNSLK